MHISLSKTTCMKIGSMQKLLTVSNLNISLNETNLTSVTTQKLLGILIDNNLQWSSQISSVCQLLNKRIYLMKHLSSYPTEKILKLYYNAYVLPIIDYCCIVWGNSNKSQADKITKLQKRTARITLQADFLTPSSTLFLKLKWLPFPQRVKLHKACQIYKIVNEMAPEYLSHAAIPKIHARSLRSSSKQ